MAFQAALLDERRLRFNLDQLLHDVLGRQKNKSIRKGEKSFIADMPVGAVAPYAEQDAQDVHDLDLAMRLGVNTLLPQLDHDGRARQGAGPRGPHHLRGGRDGAQRRPHRPAKA